MNLPGSINCAVTQEWYAGDNTRALDWRCAWVSGWAEKDGPVNQDDVSEYDDCSQTFNDRLLRVLSLLGEI